MSFKLNDLRRLKKVELLQLLDDSGVNKTKDEIIQCLISAGRCDTSSQPACSTSLNSSGLPVELDSCIINYINLSDETLVRVPHCSFMQLYSYLFFL